MFFDKVKCTFIRKMIILVIPILLYGCGVKSLELEEGTPTASVITQHTSKNNGVMGFLLYTNYKNCRGVYTKASTTIKIKDGQELTTIPANGPQSLLIQKTIGGYVGHAIITFIPKANKQYVLKTPPLSKEGDKIKFGIYLFEKNKSLKPVRFIKRKDNPMGKSLLIECMPDDIDSKLARLRK